MVRCLSARAAGPASRKKRTGFPMHFLDFKYSTLFRDIQDIRDTKLKL